MIHVHDRLYQIDYSISSLLVRSECKAQIHHASTHHNVLRIPLDYYKIQSQLILPIYFIVGPTAIGKSSLAIKLAKKLNGHIINVDSMQVYENLKILTARPNQKEIQRLSIIYMVMLKDLRDTMLQGGVKRLQLL